MKVEDDDGGDKRKRERRTQEEDNNNTQRQQQQQQQQQQNNLQQQSAVREEIPAVFSEGRKEGRKEVVSEERDQRIRCVTYVSHDTLTTLVLLRCYQVPIY